MKNNRPTFREFKIYVLHNYAPFWKEIGLLLELPTTHLCIIEVDHPNNCVNQCTAMFHLWIERDPYATWKKLIEVLDEIDRTHGKVYILMHVYVLMCICATYKIIYP